MSRAATVTFMPRNRMARILSDQDRKSFADHVASADKAVEGITHGLIGSIDGDVRTLVRLCRQDDGDIFGQSREIGRQALTIVEAARMAGRSGLADVAKGVWEMIDALSGRGVWHTEALRLHVDALGALLSVATASEADAVAHELARMREAIGVATAP